MRYGLSRGTIQKICAILSCYPRVKKAVLYGSRAKGNYKTGSDIDLTLIGEDLSLDLLYKILRDIDELFLPYTVDLSIFKDIGDPDVIEHIQRVGVTFYNRSEIVSEAVASELLSTQIVPAKGNKSST
ncbi:MAG: nucleotidyltransferase domain-containing protein [Anaerolineales bacterium]|nr:nucleotidyltransferase domain-containing protein [Anaerolineales bacterium]